MRRLKNQQSTDVPSACGRDEIILYCGGEGRALLGRYKSWNFILKFSSFVLLVYGFYAKIMAL